MQGAKIHVDRQALDELKDMCPPHVKPIIIADRGFGNERWFGDVTKWGWQFVQRLSKQHYVEVDQHIGMLPELGIRKGHLPKDWGWGWGVMVDCKNSNRTRFRLVTLYDIEAGEPWYLVTNIGDVSAQGIVNAYKKPCGPRPCSAT